MGTLGTFTSPRHVEQAVIDHLVKWGETFVAEAERQFGLDPRDIPVPDAGQFTTVSDAFNKWPEQQMPAVLVVAPGNADDFHTEADGKITATLATGIMVLASSSHPGAGREVAQILGAAYRQLMLTVPNTDINLRARPKLIGERYGEGVRPNSERTMGSARLIFSLEVRNWADLKGSPLDRENPPEDPYAEPPGGWPTVHPERLFSEVIHAKEID